MIYFAERIRRPGLSFFVVVSLCNLAARWVNGFGHNLLLGPRAPEVGLRGGAKKWPAAMNIARSSSRSLAKFTLKNEYDNWRSDAVVPMILPLDEENVQQCLDAFIESNYGEQMFGCHEKAQSIDITGTLELVEVAGPEIVLQLEGAFWHRRETVLGRAAMWLNACMPEITEVTVPDLDDLEDSKDIFDEYTGGLIATRDKRSPDFNGDRAAMEYQGIDPDMRGPFLAGPGSITINPV
jgi:hypothetical protein